MTRSDGDPESYMGDLPIPPFKQVISTSFGPCAWSHLKMTHNLVVEFDVIKFAVNQAPATSTGRSKMQLCQQESVVQMTVKTISST